MVKKILVFNVGSSSIKYSLFKNKKRIVQEQYEKLKTIQQYSKAFEDIYKKLKKEKIDIILHRVVHGGEIKKPARINNKIKKQIRKYSKFAPLHNPKELAIINLSQRFKKPQYAIFDTMFFSELPEISQIYPIPTSISKKHKIKKYGFHGLSHKSASQSLKGKTIVCHLGHGVSISAIKNKKPIDTSMGLTPMEGAMMCKRSGSIDPGIITFLQKKGYNTEEILNSQSGLKAISEYSDFRDILKNIKQKKSKLAYNLFIFSITKYIGQYIAILNGVNNLVFTGAIGENVPKLRKDICKNFKFLGLKIDKKKNKKNNSIISSKNSKIKVHIHSANEDEIMVKEILK